MLDDYTSIYLSFLKIRFLNCKNESKSVHTPPSPYINRVQEHLSKYDLGLNANIDTRFIIGIWKYHYKIKEDTLAHLSDELLVLSERIYNN